MNSNNWTAITEALPPTDTPILVAGWNETSTDHGLVYGVARLLEDTDASDKADHLVTVFADDATSDLLAFDVTHWQAFQPVARPVHAGQN